MAQFPRCEPPSRLTLPSFTALAEHELARSRAVSFPVRACSFHGIAGNHLRTRQPQAETAGNPDGGKAAGRAQREWPLVKANDADLALPASMPDSRQVGEQEAEQELARRRFQNVHARDRRNDDSPVYLKNVRPLEGLVRNRPLPSEERQAAGNCEASRTSRRRSKQAACVTISETSQEHGPFHHGADRKLREIRRLV